MTVSPLFPGLQQNHSELWLQSILSFLEYDTWIVLEKVAESKSVIENSDPSLTRLPNLFWGNPKTWYQLAMSSHYLNGIPQDQKALLEWDLWNWKDVLSMFSYRGPNDNETGSKQQEEESEDPHMSIRKTSEDNNSDEESEDSYDSVRRRHNAYVDSFPVACLLEKMINRMIATTHNEVPRAFCTGELLECPPCSLFIPTSGMLLQTPLNPAKLKQLIDSGCCERAPMGKGTETVVDRNERDCWRMMLGMDVVLSNLNFNMLFTESSDAGVATPLDRVRDCMVPGRKVIAQPYSLLIYEAGGKFSPHRDTLRGVNHFGSLVVNLPVASGNGTKGGELELILPTPITKKAMRTMDKYELFVDPVDPHPSYKPSKKLKEESRDDDNELITRKTISLPNQEGITWTAFFSDILHEVKPVTKGYRVSLTYHLWTVPDSPGAVQVASTHAERKLVQAAQVSVLAAVLQKWIDRRRDAWRFIWAMDHCLSDSTCTPENLQTRDRIVYQILKQLATCLRDDDSSYICDMWSISLEVFGKVRNPSLFVRRFGLKGISFDEEEQRCRKSDKYLHTHTVWINGARLVQMEHEQEEYSYYTGNEGDKTGFRYQHSCIVVQSKLFFERVLNEILYQHCASRPSRILFQKPVGHDD